MDEVIESADSAEFDMESGLESISSDIFGTTSEEPEEFELSEESDGEVVEEPVEEVVTKNAPASWKKEMHESWSSLSPDMQDYIEQRESQMKDGLEKDRDDATLGRSMRDVMAPYDQALSQSGVDKQTMVKSLLNAHYHLSTAPPEQRQHLMQQLAQNYGVNLNQQPQENQEPVDPVIQELKNELNGLKYELNTSKQASLQEARTRVSNEVNEFAQNHEYFDEVSDEVALLIKAGSTLESAYEKAIWANPITRQKEMDRLDKEKTDTEMAAKMEKVRAAKKAKSVNVSSRDTNKTPTGFMGSMEDTMRDTYRNIQNRT